MKLQQISWLRLRFICVLPYSGTDTRSQRDLTEGTVMVLHFIFETRYLIFSQL
jgi:hypothetical protein